MKLWGQVEIKAVAIPAMLSFGTWLGTLTWTKHSAAEDMRREVESHARALKGLEGLPVEELKKLPAKVELIRASADAVREASNARAAEHSAALARIEALLQKR